MESFENQPNTNLEQGSDRAEKMKRAEERVRYLFEEALAKTLERIGANPYFNSIEQTNG